MACQNTLPQDGLRNYDQASIKSLASKHISVRQMRRIKNPLIGILGSTGVVHVAILGLYAQLTIHSKESVRLTKRLSPG